MRQLKVILIFLLPLLHTLIIFLSESKVNYSSQFHCCSLWEDLHLLSLNTDTDFRLITLPILYLHCNPLSANARENYPNDRSHQYHPSLKKKKSSMPPHCSVVSSAHKILSILLKLVKIRFFYISHFTLSHFPQSSDTNHILLFTS